MEQVVLVDEEDARVGLEEKVSAHMGEGKLHRAFTVFVSNKKGDFLICQRSKSKMLWPLIWDSACASHPMNEESYEDAGKRRLQEELGFTCRLELVDKFQYQVAYRKIGSENEICATLVGSYDGVIEPNSDEVASWRWIKRSDLEENISKDPDKFAPWFIIALKRLNRRGKWKGQKNQN